MFIQLHTGVLVRRVCCTCNRTILYVLTQASRVYPWKNAIVSRNSWPNRTTDIEENVPQNPLFGFYWLVRFFFSRKNWKTVFTYFPQKRLYSFLSADAPFPQKWSCSQKMFSCLFWNCFFLIIKWKIFKTSFLTKKVTLIFVAGCSFQPKTVMSSHKWFFTVFSESTAFFEKLVS